MSRNCRKLCGGSCFFEVITKGEKLKGKKDCAIFSEKQARKNQPSVK
jgi:hypothetical protein